MTAMLNAKTFQHRVLMSIVYTYARSSGLCMQVMFKGYEEARVALSALLFSMPCCIIIGIEYGIFMGGKLRKVTIPSWMVQLFVLSAEKLPGTEMCRPVLNHCALCCRQLSQPVDSRSSCVKE